MRHVVLQSGFPSTAKAATRTPSSTASWKKQRIPSRRNTSSAGCARREPRLWVLPAAVGQGAPLFTGLARPVTLSLFKTTAFPSGILELCYKPAGHGA